jgi:hypothetical protein
MLRIIDIGDPRSLLLAFFGIVCLLASACDAAPPPSGELAASTTVSPDGSADPKTATGASNSVGFVVEPPTAGFQKRLEHAHRPLVVVSGEIRTLESSDRAWRVIQLVTLDSTGSQIARFEFGTYGAMPIGWDLIDDDVLVNFENSIVRFRVDGTVSQVLRGPMKGRMYRHVLVSPDGSKIVFSEFGDADCGGSCVVFAAADGTELARIPQTMSSLASTIGGYPQPSSWRGSDAVLIRGQQTGEGYRGLGTLSVNGSFVSHDGDADGIVSPSGDLLLRLANAPHGSGTEGLECGFRSTIQVVDIDDNIIVVESSERDSAIIAPQWSPNSTEILFARRAVPQTIRGSCVERYEDWAAASTAWWVLSLAEKTEAPIVDPRGWQASWYERDRWASLACSVGDSELSVDENGRTYLDCLDTAGSSLEIDVLLDGEVLASGRFTRVLGTLP